MNIRKYILSSIFFILSLSLWSQMRDLDIVKKNYPEVYSSIVKNVEEQWTNDRTIRQAVIEGQARSFLDLMDIREPIDEEAMTDAILSGSLKGEQEYNMGIIDDLSIKNPFPLLRCDWYKVKSEYYKAKSPTKNSLVKQNNYNRSYGEPNYSKNRAEIRYGVKLAFGTATMNINDKFRKQTGLDNKYGFLADIGLVAQLKKKNMFLQGELSAIMTTYRFSGYSADEETNDYYDYTSEASLGYLKALCYIGINKNINSKINFIIGAGPYVAYKFKIDGEYEYYWDEEWEDWNDYAAQLPNNVTLRNVGSSEDISEEDLRNIDFGLSALIGVEFSQFQISVQPSFGLIDMSKDKLGMKTFGIQLSAAYFF
ncbi:hypothetical protein LJC00_02125 [Dysgonomonas sp. OttesenSCG-928-M03]|nr:hypothetical protein [Dysgonomonas sp. OttesenSCG-928-M03]